MTLMLITCLADKSRVTLSQLVVDPLSQRIKISGASLYKFTSASNVVHKALTYVPNPFYRTFTIFLHFETDPSAAAVLFSITDKAEKLMHISLKLSAEQSGRQKVQFFYTEPGSETSKEAASFDILSRGYRPYILGVTVAEDQVTLYTDCSEDPQVVKFEHLLNPMILDEKAKFFVGQAGHADPDKFEVIIRNQNVLC